MALSEAARKKRNEYQRNWRKLNREKVKAYEERKWEKAAALNDDNGQQDDDSELPAANSQTIREGAKV